MTIMTEQNALVARVDECLPQTQCTQCGYPRCLDYAQAIISGETEINRCPPGGETTLTALASLTGNAYKPLNTELRPYPGRLVARIREAECIGCVLCIKACPVDAIVGAAKLMHTVIAAECTGCELCVEPCPMDCIDLLPVHNTASGKWLQFSDEEVGQYRYRAEQHFRRLNIKKKCASSKQRDTAAPKIDRQQVIKDAVARVRARRNAESSHP